jgi:hypothetical protein
MSRLTLTATATERYLRLSYVYENRTPGPVYVCALVEDHFGLGEDLRLDQSRNPDAIPTPEIGYVSWGGEGRAVFHLGRAEPAGGETPWPWAVRVEPDRRFRASIRARLPLLEWSPRLPPSEIDVDEVRVDRLALSLECAGADDVTGAEAHPGLAEVHRIRFGSSLRLRAEAALPGGVPILRRRRDVPRMTLEGA